VWWILIWALLLLAAAAAIGLLGWRLVRQLIALGRELAASGDRVAQVMSAADAGGRVAAPSSVFLDPDALADHDTATPPAVHRRRHGSAR